MLLLWSLFLGLALVGADWYVERGGRGSMMPSYEGGTLVGTATAGGSAPTIFEDGTPIPPPK